MGAIFFLLAIINLFLTDFFILSNFLVPSLFFELSLKDLLLISETEGGSSNLVLWIVNIPSILAIFYILVLRRPPKRLNQKIKYGLIGIYILACGISLSSTDFFYKSQDSFETSFQYYLANSKPYHFYKSYKEWKITRELAFGEEGRLIEYIRDFQSFYPNREFISEFYPLLKRKSAESALSEFFPKKSVKPTIVFVLSEGLSSSISGTQTVNGSLTPFTDSLRQHSLYWENFMSNVDRSFSALPNLLGSLPYGTIERGFINKTYGYGENITYPDHWNLITFLKNQDYQCNFYYGGYSGFDNIIHYTKFSGFDKIIDELKFGIKKEDKEGWGFDDGELYRRSFIDVDSIPEGHPAMHFYMTLTYHHPYVLANELYLDLDFQDSLMKEYGISEKMLGQMSRSEFGTILYADQSLKHLFRHFKKRKDFENTIFIVLGDHGSGFYFHSDRFNNYRVPLLIYSPMLEKGEVFKGTSSHIDVLPSLTALLGNNFGMPLPAMEAYLGQGLSGSHTFEAKRMIPLNIFNYDKFKFILDDLVLFDDKVYRFDDQFKMKECTIDSDIERIKKAYKSYMIINNYVLNENKIWLSREN